MMGQVGGKNGKPGSFAKARVKTPADTKQKVLFKDVAGAKEEKEELTKEEPASEESTTEEPTEEEPKNPKKSRKKRKKSKNKDGRK